MSAPARNALFWLVVAVAVGSALVMKLALSWHVVPGSSRRDSGDIRPGGMARLAADESHAELEKAIRWYLEHSMGALNLPATELPLDRDPMLAERLVERRTISPGVPCTVIRDEYRAAAWWGSVGDKGAFSLRVSPYRYRLIGVRAVERILSGDFPSFEVSFDLEPIGPSSAAETIQKTLPPVELGTPLDSHRVVFWAGDQGLFPAVPRTCGESIN